MGEFVITISTLNKNDIPIIADLDEEKWIKFMLDSTSLAMYTIDLKTHAVEVSKSFSEVLNTDKTYFENISDIYSLVHPEDLHILQRATEMVLAKDFSVEPICIRGITKNNSFIWVNCSFGVLKDVNKQPNKLIGTIADFSKTMYAHEINKLSREGASDYYAYYDFLTGDLYFNQLFNDLIGFSTKSLNLKNEFLDALSTEESKKIYDQFLILKSSLNDYVRFSFNIKDKNGDFRDFSFSGKVARDLNRNPYLVSGILQDITEINKAKEITKILLNIPNGYTYIFDLEQDRMEFSSKIVEIIPLKSHVFSNALETWKAFIHPDDLEKFITSYTNLLEQKSDIHSIEYRVKGIDGSYIWLAARSNMTYDHLGKPLLLAGSVIEISSMSVYNKHLEEKRLFNKITNFPNRIHFIQNFEAAANLKNLKGFVLMLNIDGFRHINNLYGIDAGDKLLSELAKSLSLLLNNKGQLYHFDGDLFVCNLPNFNRTKTEQLISKIRALDSREVSSHKLNFTVSLAATHYNSKAITIDELLKNISIAMRKLREKGQNTYLFFEDSDRTPYMKEAQLESNLIEQIKNNFEGFEVYFQPLISGKNDECLGAEALLRFFDNEGKMISPIEFIPILEKTGYIIEVEKWVLDTVVKKINQWLPMKKNKDFIININTSAQTLKSTGFKERFCKTLKNDKINPRNIILEITESALILDIENILSILTYIRDFGVRIAMDDFGTGYSSLGYLKSLPVDEIKVDRSFILNIENNKNDLAFVGSIINLIHSLGDFVCVEGVETEVQRDLIKTFNIEFFQGFYYSKPLSVNDFEAKYVIS